MNFARKKTARYLLRNTLTEQFFYNCTNVTNQFITNSTFCVELETESPASSVTNERSNSGVT